MPGGIVRGILHRGDSDDSVLQRYETVVYFLQWHETISDAHKDETALDCCPQCM